MGLRLGEVFFSLFNKSNLQQGNARIGLRCICCTCAKPHTVLPGRVVLNVGTVAMFVLRRKSGKTQQMPKGQDVKLFGKMPSTTEKLLGACKTKNLFRASE